MYSFQACSSPTSTGFSYADIASRSPSSGSNVSRSSSVSSTGSSSSWANIASRSPSSGGSNSRSPSVSSTGSTSSSRGGKRRKLETRLPLSETGFYTSQSTPERIQPHSGSSTPERLRSLSSSPSSSPTPSFGRNQVDIDIHPKALQHLNPPVSVFEHVDTEIIRICSAEHLGAGGIRRVTIDPGTQKAQHSLKGRLEEHLEKRKKEPMEDKKTNFRYKIVNYEPEVEGGGKHKTAINVKVQRIKWEKEPTRSGSAEPIGQHSRVKPGVKRKAERSSKHEQYRMVNVEQIIKSYDRREHKNNDLNQPDEKGIFMTFPWQPESKPVNITCFLATKQLIQETENQPQIDKIKFKDVSGDLLISLSSLASTQQQEIRELQVKRMSCSTEAEGAAAVRLLSKCSQWTVDHLKLKADQEVWRSLVEAAAAHRGLIVRIETGWGDLLRGRREDLGVLWKRDTGWGWMVDAMTVKREDLEDEGWQKITRNLDLLKEVEKVIKNQEYFFNGASIYLTFPCTLP